jgi:hypothetical protein
MIDAAADEAQDPAAKKVNKDDAGNNAIPGSGSDSDHPPAATAQTKPATDELSPQATTPSAENAEPASAGFPPRRRGILLGTHVEASAAVDDEKSLSWMATQAVKALNAVKASQSEQLQALKAKAEMSEGEPAPVSMDEAIDLETNESVGVSGEYEPVIAEPGVMDDGLAQAQKAPAGEPAPVVPAAARMASTQGAPWSRILILGVLVVIGVLGYRHWSSRNNVTSDLSTPSSVAIEPTNPATGIDMTRPPISAVAATPAAASGRAESPSAVAGAASTPTPPPASPGAAITATHDQAVPKPTGLATGAATPQPAPENPPTAVNREEGQPPAVAAVPAPEPATEPASPPAVEAGMAPMPGSATGIQPATVGVAPQPAPAYPASATKPEAWYPSAVPAAPSPPAEAGMNAGQSVSPASPPPVESGVTASQPASPPSPPPAVEANVPARQPVMPAPAARPRYPANGYGGYYRPPSSWQPYYQPGYPQAPARR